jgi:4-azaleucine resistance transporter AzlC
LASAPAACQGEAAVSGSTATTSPTTLRAGARAAIPFAAAVFVVAISFGISARAAGMPGAAAIAMSAFVYAGSAQFAAVAILGQGGSVIAAAIAAMLMNARYLAMGLAVGPSLPGGRIRRAFEGQAMVDASWALANRGDGRFDRNMLVGSSAAQYVTWLLGTVVGVAAGGALPNPEELGIDVVFPAFFLALLVAELRTRQAGAVAVAAAVIAVVLGLLAPAGIGILAASAVALVGLRGSAER